jgi:membrane protein DedA with SNARE-associated domain
VAAGGVIWAMDHNTLQAHQAWALAFVIVALSILLVIALFNWWRRRR